MKDFHFTPLDPEDLAAKMTVMLFAKLEQRFEELEQSLRELEQRIQNKEPAEYLRPSEVERRFGIGRDLLGYLVSRGSIKRYDAGSHGRYRTDELESYLKRHHVEVEKRK